MGSCLSWPWCCLVSLEILCAELTIFVNENVSPLQNTQEIVFLHRYMEFILLARRISIAITPLFFGGSSLGYQYLILTIILMISFGVQMYWNPFRSNINNAMEVLCICVLISICVCSAGQDAFDPRFLAGWVVFWSLVPIALMVFFTINLCLPKTCAFDTSKTIRKSSIELPDGPPQSRVLTTASELNIRVPNLGIPEESAEGDHGETTRTPSIRVL